MELHWSRHWADVVGADGSMITHLLGTVAPLLDDERADALRRAEHDIYPGGVRSTLERAGSRAHEIATEHGMRAVLACGVQSARRAVRVHLADDEIASDRWQRWQPVDRALDGVVRALVIRHHAPPGVVERLAATWVAVFGELDEHYRPEDDQTPQRCGVCGSTAGARGVTEAEAARYARHLRRGDQVFLEAANADLERAREALRTRDTTHVSKVEVIDRVLGLLERTRGITPKARATIEAEFSITDAVRERFAEHGTAAPR